MRRVAVVLVMAFVFIGTVCAADFSQYPSMFLEEGILVVVFVIGDNADIADAIGAVDIATSLQFYSKKKMESAAKLASEITEAESQNLIVVGGPCANPIAAHFFGYPTNCMDGFVKGKATMRLFESGEKVAMVVAGATAADTRRACRVLANFNDYREEFSGTEIVVSGTSLTDVSVSKVS